jgi:DmsE family decaheme c-type cytochrome
MNDKHTPMYALLFLLCFLVGVAARAEAPAAASQTSATEDANKASAYTEKGADTCLKCHDEDSEFPVFDIFKTKHAQPADKRSPFAGLQCEACHGPGANHAKQVPKGHKQAPIIKYGAKSWVSTEKQNQVCLGCHENQNRITWKGGAHSNGDVACVSCHKIHTPHDQILSTTEQPDVCYKCHKQQRADFMKPSTHPVRAGQMACSDCHKVHGAVTANLLIKPTLNETCYTCHAEKRGPFLWEHAPVAEDCSNCHTVHGSIHPSLLTKRAPLLCQQCHSQAGHPSTEHGPGDLPSGTPSGFLLSGACLNCHSQVHGSNHPSGVKLMR